MSEIKASSGKVEQTPIINNFKNPTKQDKLAMKLQKLGKSVILTEELSILLTRGREGFVSQVKPLDD